VRVCRPPFWILQYGMVAPTSLTGRPSKPRLSQTLVAHSTVRIIHNSIFSPLTYPKERNCFLTRNSLFMYFLPSPLQYPLSPKLLQAWPTVARGKFSADPILSLFARRARASTTTHMIASANECPRSASETSYSSSHCRSSGTAMNGKMAVASRDQLVKV
jgi:hypothetical protein